MEMANGDIIDGENERRSNFGRFINHSVRRANCQACDAWPSGTQMAAVYLETTRTIKAGDELLFDCARAPPNTSATPPSGRLSRLSDQWVCRVCAAHAALADGPTYWDEQKMPRWKRIAIDYL